MAWWLGDMEPRKLSDQEYIKILEEESDRQLKEMRGYKEALKAISNSDFPSPKLFKTKEQIIELAKNAIQGI